jgi:uncharacterized membrane protein YgcG
MSERRLRPVALLAMIGLLASLGAWVFLHRRAGAVERPRYIFVNETDDHTHDLSFKMTIKLAEKRSGVENALVFLKRLPPDRTIEQVATELFERWQIGRQRAGRGILYLYSEEENLFKIEVSYGLEALFPDALCHELATAAQTYMLSEIPQDFVSELLIPVNLRAKDVADVPGVGWRSPAWLGCPLLGGR